MSALAEDREEHVLSVARKDADKALALVTQERASRYELIRALAYMVQSTRAAVDVAECRGERLEALE